MKSREADTKNRMKLRVWPVFVPVLLIFSVGNYWFSATFPDFPLLDLFPGRSHRTWVENFFGHILIYVQIPSGFLALALTQWASSRVQVVSITFFSSIFYTLIAESLVWMKMHNVEGGLAWKAEPTLEAGREIVDCEKTADPS